MQLNESNAVRLTEKDGWACLYDVTIDRGYYAVELAQRCFANSTGDPNKIVILSQHNPDWPVGKAANFTEHAEGLWMDFLLNPAVREGAEIISNIDAGILTGLSCGFDVDVVETERRGGKGASGYEVDIIKQATLRECSVVTFPALDGARIENSVPRDAAVAFAVIDGDSPREQLRAGDHLRLATFPATRVRPVKRERLAEDDLHPGARDELVKLLNIKWEKTT